MATGSTSQWRNQLFRNSFRPWVIPGPFKFGNIWPFQGFLCDIPPSPIEMFKKSPLLPLCCEKMACHCPRRQWRDDWRFEVGQDGWGWISAVYVLFSLMIHDLTLDWKSSTLSLMNHDRTCEQSILNPKICSRRNLCSLLINRHLHFFAEIRMIYIMNFILTLYREIQRNSLLISFEDNTWYLSFYHSIKSII